MGRSRGWDVRGPGDIVPPAVITAVGIPSAPMTIDDLHRPIVRCIPSDDRALLEAAKDALGDAPVDDDDFDVAAHLQAALGSVYPKVAVVPMDPLASAWGERAWYVYRDGR